MSSGSSSSSAGGVLGSFRRAREWAYPQLTSSAFLEKGVLTPEEYVTAGDELVFRCPTWEWMGSTSASISGQKQKGYLPSNKQYLITRNVPCRNRVSALETNLKMELEVSNDGNNNQSSDGNGIDEWMISSILVEGEQEEKQDHTADDFEDDFDIVDEDGEIIEKTKAMDLKETKKEVADVAPEQQQQQQMDDKNDDEYCDMDNYEDEDILIDEDVADAGINSNSTNSNNNGTNSSILKTRTYDISITYDKYYQVPRVWMIGRDEQDQPLTSTQMMEDVISDYANKTVTMEIHPHGSAQCPQASIHPCQHANVMKAIVKNLVKGSSGTKNKTGSNGDTNNNGTNDGLPSVEMYLFIFLKFVSSMIPTINYDFTMEVTADTTK